MFIGGDKSKSGHKIYKYYQEDKSVDVEIRAVVYVPEKILTGICFPKAEVDNKRPHLTLMTGGQYKPVNSNTILEATCADEDLFKNEYAWLASDELSEQMIKEAPGITV